MGRPRARIWAAAGRTIANGAPRRVYTPLHPNRDPAPAATHPPMPKKPPKPAPEAAASPEADQITKRKRGRPPQPKPTPRPRKRPLRETDKHERARTQRRTEGRAMAKDAYRRALQSSAKPAPGPSESKARARGGFEPTPEDRARVETLSGLGFRLDEIALVVLNPVTGGPIDEKTLRSYFERELAMGQIKANSKVIEALYNKALGEGNQSVTACIWWTKCRAGWKERTVVELEDRSGVLVPPPQMTPAEWLERVAKANAEKTEPGADDADEG